MRTSLKALMVCLTLAVLLLQTESLYAQPPQTFSNFVAASINPGCGSSQIAVSGVGDINFAYGLGSICLDITHANVDDIDITLIGPESQIISIISAGFPNGGANVNACFEDCTSYDNVGSTSDSAPYTGTYFPSEGYSSVNPFSGTTNADGTWTLELCDANGGSGTLNSWSITFLRRVPDIAFPTFFDPSCPGEDDGVIISSVAQNGFCYPQSYTIRKDGILFQQVSDSVFTGLTSGITYTNVQALSANGDGFFWPGPFFLDDSDTEPPYFPEGCPPDVTVNSSTNMAGDCDANVFITDPFVDDNCDGNPILSVEFLLPDNSTINYPGIPGATYSYDFLVGLTEITYTVEDASGNTGTCVQFVEVYDDEDPEFVMCPADITIGTSTLPGTCTGEATITDPTPIDNCEVSSFTVSYEFADATMSGPLTGDPGNAFTTTFQLGVNFAIYDVEDESGNTGQCIQTITVIDDSPPTWNDPSLESTIIGTCGVDDAQDLLQANFPLATDDCVNPIYHEIQQISGLDCGGGNASTLVTWITVDDEITESTDTFVVTVILEDVDPPVMSGVPPDVTVSCFDPLPADPTVTASDLCDGVITVDVDVTTDMIGSCSSGEISETHTYEYTATDFCGNSVVETYVVYVSNDLLVDLGPDVLICGGGNTQLDAGVSGAMYNWSTGATTQTITVGGGTYSVTVTNSGGCCESDEIIVIEDNPPDASAVGGTLDCSGNAIVIMGMSVTPNVTYGWTGPGGFTSGSQNPSVSQAGTYILTVTSAAGCTATASAVVMVNVDVPDASASGGTISCTQTSVQLMGMSVTAGVSYSWTGPGGFTSDDQNPTVTVPGAYQLSVTAPNACVAMAIATVIDDTAMPVLNVTVDTLTCLTTEVTINLTSNLTSTYSWTGPGGFSSAAQNPSVMEPGTYTVTATAANGCSSQLAVMVIEDITVPNVSATGGTLTCEMNSVQLMGSSTTSDVTYAWTGPGGFSSAAQNPVVSVAGDYTLVVTAQNGCTADQTVAVDADADFPDVTATGGTITCTVSEIQLMGGSATAGVTYGWTGPGGFVSADQNPTVNTAGTYVLTVTALNGCTASSSAVVAQNTTRPDASARIGGVNCETAVITLEGISLTPGVVYGWTGPGGFTSANQNTSTNTQGQYILTVTAPNGCTRMDTINVQADITPISALITTSLVQTGGDGEAIIQINGGAAPYMVIWDNGETGDTAMMLSVGVHTVTVTDNNDCQEVFTFNMTRRTTICDVQPQSVGVGEVVMDALSDTSTIVPTVLEQPCVTSAYGLPLPDQLEMQSYLYYYNGSAALDIQFTLDATDADVKGFVFTCDCGSLFCAQNCIGGFDNDTPFDLDESMGFYYVVVIGPRDATYAMSVRDLNATVPTCDVDGQIVCGEMIMNTPTGDDEFNTVDPSKNIYLDCYDGGSAFVGPESVYRIVISEASRVTFDVVSSARIGLFLYNHRCGQNCIDFDESAFAGASAQINVELNPGTYNLVIDQSSDPEGKPFTLTSTCTTLDDNNVFIDPILLGGGFNVVECPVDSNVYHDIRFALTSSSIGGVPLVNNDRIFMFTEDRRITGRRSGYIWKQGQDLTVRVYGDKPDNSLSCGYALGDRLLMRVKKKSGGSVPANPTYAPIDGSTVTAQGNFVQDGKSLITSLNSDPNAVPDVFNVNPGGDNVKFNDRRTVFEIQSNLDWQILPADAEWITKVSIEGSSNATSGSGDKNIEVEFTENPDCNSRRDSVKVLGVNGEFKTFAVRQQGTSGLPDVEVTSQINADGTVTAMVTGGLPPYMYLWSTGDMTQTTADSLPDGTYTLVITDQNGCSTTVEIQVGTTGVYDPSLGEHITISPNPTNGVVRIELDFDQLRDVRYAIFNAIGQRVYETNLMQMRNATEYVDLSGSTPGLYIVEFYVNGRIFGSKLVLQD